MRFTIQYDSIVQYSMHAWTGRLTTTTYRSTYLLTYLLLVGGSRYSSDEAMPAQGLMEMRPTASASSGPSSGWTYRYHNKRPSIPFGFGLSCESFIDFFPPLLLPFSSGLFRTRHSESPLHAVSLEDFGQNSDVRTYELPTYVPTLR